MGKCVRVLEGGRRGATSRYLSVCPRFVYACLALEAGRNYKQGDRAVLSTRKFQQTQMKEAENKKPVRGRKLGLEAGNW